MSLSTLRGGPSTSMGYHGAGRRRCPTECPEHPDAALIEDYRAGDSVCSQCGFVVAQRVVDDGAEWRTFNNDRSNGDPSRVGGPENNLLDGSDLSTMISGGKGDAAFDEQGHAKYQNRRSMSQADRALTNAFKEMSQLAERINLPKTIVDHACVLFKEVHLVKTLKGRANDAVATASLYIACRQQGVPRTFNEICANSRITKKEIGRCFKLILCVKNTCLDQISTNDFMSRFCSNLGLPNAVERAAATIACVAVDRDIVAGRSPISVAAAAIYMASQASELKRTPKEISEVAGVADVTIRQAYKLMSPRASELFPKDFVFVTPIDQLPLA